MGSEIPRDDHKPDAFRAGSTIAVVKKPLYFDDLEVGMQWTSGRRTVTEADIALFASVPGDFNPLHTDEVFASGLQRRVPIRASL